MSCKGCREAQEKQGAYYFRWKRANIEMRGCAKHISEVMDVLIEAQQVIKEAQHD